MQFIDAADALALLVEHFDGVKREVRPLRSQPSDEQNIDLDAYRPAYSAFMHHQFEHSCLLATKAARWKAGYFVELFEDGNYRVVPSPDTGGMYEITGLLLPVSTLSAGDWDVQRDRPNFRRARQEMRAKFRASGKGSRDASLSPEMKVRCPSERQ